MKKIVLLQGGKSGEREISLESSAQIARILQNDFEICKIDPIEYLDLAKLVLAIKKEKPFIVFNGLHGDEGENGEIQKVMEAEGIPFTGSGSQASKIAMDKYLTAEIAKEIDIDVPQKIFLNNQKEITPAILQKIEYPVVIKPNDAGSSLGIFIVENDQELLDKFSLLKRDFSQILIEQFIKGRELTVTILGNQALPVVEIIPKNGWYDFTNKYTSGNTIYQAPAKLSKEESDKVRNDALKLFQKVNCKGYSRIDFRYDGEKFYLLEINTLPGMTKLSLTPMAAKAIGVDFKSLLHKIIEYSI